MRTYLSFECASQSAIMRIPYLKPLGTDGRVGATPPVPTGSWGDRLEPTS